MNMSQWGTISTSGNTYALTVDQGGRPPDSPTGLIATRAVETKKGWLGQVYVDKEIVFESRKGHDSRTDAIDEANTRVVEVFSKLFRQED